MMLDDRRTKLLTRALRHAPYEYALRMDANGWVACAQIVERTGISADALARIVDADPKQRFAFNAQCTQVRAQYGHTLSKVRLEYLPTLPPETLFHGTTRERARAIFASEGLRPQRRQYVHLTSNYADAADVTTRYAGEVCVLAIDARALHAIGEAFMRAGTSDVWLTRRVPRAYIAEAPCAL